ncbi:hypothetical protein ACHAPT_009858 [Fusarium lateritium]
MKLTTLIAATAVSLTANALYLPNDNARRYPPHLDDGGIHFRDPFFPHRDESSLARPTVVFRPVIGHPETKTIPPHIIPPKDPKDGWPDTLRYGEEDEDEDEDEQYETETSDPVHYSHIEVHKAVPRSLKKRQGPKATESGAIKANAPKDEREPFLGPLIDEVGQRYEAQIPKNLGEKGQERVIIYPKTQRKGKNLGFLAGLIDEAGERSKAQIPDISDAKDEGKESIHRKNTEGKNDELLENIMDKVEQQSGQTPQSTEAKGNGKATKDEAEQLLEHVIEQAEQQYRPRIPKVKGNKDKNDGLLKHPLSKAGQRCKSLMRRFLRGLPPYPSFPLIGLLPAFQDGMKALKGPLLDDPNNKKDESPPGIAKVDRLEYLRVKASRPVKTLLGRNLAGQRPGKTSTPIETKHNKREENWGNLQGYSPEYIKGLLTLEGKEMCRKYPKNCIKAKGPLRHYTKHTMQAKARFEDAKAYAMARMSPDDFRGQRLRMDEEARCKQPRPEVHRSNSKGKIFKTPEKKMEPKEEYD